MFAGHPSLTAALFPGQGVSLAGARPRVEAVLPDLMQRCHEALGLDPFAHASASTRFAQPAVFLASLAGWSALAPEPEPQVLAGHSLGEISALAAAGAISPEDALEVVMLRGRLMDEAAHRAGDGGMLAVLKGTAEDAHAVAKQTGCHVANDNAPGQTVLAGTSASLQAASELARERGLRAMKLDVAGAFHSPAMGRAQEPLLRVLQRVRIRDTSVPVYSGLTARPFRDVPSELSRALTSPVRWREVMLALAGLGAGRFVDVGPDRVLARLVERNLPNAAAEALEDRVGVGA